MNMLDPSDELDPEVGGCSMSYRLPCAILRRSIAVL
jgi:hypothetical protein